MTKQRKQPVSRLRMNGTGNSVFVTGRWIPADDKVVDNVKRGLKKIVKVPVARQRQLSPQKGDVNGTGKGR